MKLIFIAFTSLVGVSSHVLAIEPSQCIRLNEMGGAHGVNLFNSCDRKINVRYCVDNQKSNFKCSKNGFGEKTLAPGSKELIPYYSSDGAGRVYWAACVYPSIVSGWSGPGDRYDCN